MTNRQVLAALFASLFASACGGSSAASGPVASPSGQPVVVQTTPAEAEVAPGGTLQFASRVTGATETSVTWEVEEADGGTIDASGLYTAPAIEGTFHVRASSIASASKGTSVVHVKKRAIVVEVTPSVVSMPVAESVTFTAVVTGATDVAVSWSIPEGLGCGSISATGVYLAPAVAGTCHVVATSAADPTKSGYAAITVTATPVVTVSVSPASTSVAAGGTVTFVATVTNATGTGVDWSVTPAGCGTITTGGVYTAPTSAGVCTVAATSQSDPTRVARATITVSAPTPGRTYAVGPTRAYTTLDAVQGIVAPGDLVVVDGDATYAGGIVLSASGTASAPITYRGLRVNGKRPVISGGTNSVEVTGSHVVMEGFELTRGSYRCFFQHGDGNTLRDSAVHGCPTHGVLGADADSGSFLMEYVEIYQNGSGTGYHQVYMATDETRYPGAVFRMQHCYVHDATGGDSVKSRAGRNEIYYNWIEGGTYHELELIGADNTDPGVREDSDVVGNVLRKTGTFYVTRFGSDYGDGVTGQSKGRFRFVNNTVITLPGSSAVFRLFGGIESLEAHNNVFYTSSGGVNLYRDVEAIWVTGSATIYGTNNWVSTGSTNVPTGWTGTLSGADPMFTNLAGYDLVPTATSPLRAAGGDAPAFSAHPFPAPLFPPTYEPPAHAVGTSPIARPMSAAIDIGAYQAP